MRESEHQRAVFRWSRQPSVRDKWPEIKLLFHVKNETTEGARRVQSDKAMGVKPGVPDLCLPVARGRYHGLFIEMKNERGRVSEAQKWWVRELNGQDYAAVVCYGWESAAMMLEWYLEGARDEVSV